MPVNYEAIRARGWRQGSILSEADSAAVIGTGDVAPQDGCRLILISHSCDILHQGSGEPTVEFCIATPVAGKPDGNKTFGKNPRSIQIPIDTPSGVAFLEVVGSSRIHRERQCLEERSPDNAALLSDYDCDVLLRWIADRYLRSALPDEFNSRIAPARSKIARVMEREGTALVSLYVGLSSWEDVSEDATYSLELVGVMRTSAYEDDALRRGCEGAVANVAKALRGCRGINDVDFRVEPESRISLDALRFLAQLELDYLSLRADPQGDLAVIK